jgi:hypothetical protein
MKLTPLNPLYSGKREREIVRKVVDVREKEMVEVTGMQNIVS